jgi:hypothetical protein
MLIDIAIISQRLLSLVECSAIQIADTIDCFIDRFQHRGSGRRISINFVLAFC